MSKSFKATANRFNEENETQEYSSRQRKHRGAITRKLRQQKRAKAFEAMAANDQAEYIAITRE